MKKLIAICAAALVIVPLAGCDDASAKLDSANEPVVTIGGIYGKITALDKKTATLEVAPGTKITFARAAINGKVTKDAEQ